MAGKKTAGVPGVGATESGAVKTAAGGASPLEIVAKRMAVGEATVAEVVSTLVSERACALVEDVIDGARRAMGGRKLAGVGGGYKLELRGGLPEMAKRRLWLKASGNEVRDLRRDLTRAMDHIEREYKSQLHAVNIRISEMQQEQAVQA